MTADLLYPQLYSNGCNPHHQTQTGVSAPQRKEKQTRMMTVESDDDDLKSILGLVGLMGKTDWREGKSERADKTGESAG
ncbi:hypothetical protein FQN60_012883 [Etheostoma spectabile]|uniref:Uncharacterized protein n=1 Tax=Etheostoma spectabile TaxID=54343 RepID=A0A5J5D4A1_9PERO|nr:hypothetical protein FQN60_012883 [Etheostoma spectabile]